MKNMKNEIKQKIWVAIRMSLIRDTNCMPEFAYGLQQKRYLHPDLKHLQDQVIDKMKSLAFMEGL